MMTRAEAWKPRCARIILVNSCAKSTLDRSNEPLNTSAVTPVETEPTTSGSGDIGSPGEGRDAGTLGNAGTPGDASTPGDTGTPGDGGASDGATPRPMFTPGAQICLSDDDVKGEIIKPRPRNCLDFDPAQDELNSPKPRPEICLEAPFDDGTS